MAGASTPVRPLFVGCSNPYAPSLRSTYVSPEVDVLVSTLASNPVGFSTTPLASSSPPAESQSPAVLPMTLSNLETFIGMQGEDTRSASRSLPSLQVSSLMGDGDLLGSSQRSSPPSLVPLANTATSAEETYPSEKEEEETPGAIATLIVKLKFANRRALQALTMQQGGPKGKEREIVDSMDKNMQEARLEIEEAARILLSMSEADKALSSSTVTLPSTGRRSPDGTRSTENPLETSGLRRSNRKRKQVQRIEEVVAPARKRPNTRKRVKFDIPKAVPAKAAAVIPSPTPLTKKEIKSFSDKTPVGSRGILLKNNTIKDENKSDDKTESET